MEFSLKKYKKNDAKIFTDRDIGVNARNELNLDAMEQTDETIVMLFPLDTWGINPSFFGGLFETSLKKYGRDGFHEKYEFQYSNNEPLKESLQRDIEDDIDYVMRNIKRDK